MDSDLAEYEWPIYIVTALYTIISCSGILLNSLIVVATVQTKSLHTSCNVLVAFCAVCDVLHQTIPIFGMSAGSFVILSIGIDRFISAFIPILLYSAWHFYLMFAYASDKDVVCIPPEAFYGAAKTLWSISSCIVNVITVLVYSVVWIVLMREKNAASMSRIFRSLFIIMCCVVLGWTITMAGVLVASMIFHLQGMQMYFLHETVGLFVNTSLALNYVVYYKTSTEYRRAFRRQMKVTFDFVGLKIFSSIKDGCSTS
ncbi:hypothetical protein PFISCL1PPCAC_7947, partial [Pristionchus fissidentatus]